MNRHTFFLVDSPNRYGIHAFFEWHVGLAGQPRRLVRLGTTMEPATVNRSKAQ